MTANAGKVHEHGACVGGRKTVNPWHSKTGSAIEASIMHHTLKVVGWVLVGKDR